MFAVLYIWLRFARLTVRRYGVTYLIRSQKPRHAGTGRGLRVNPLGRQHGWGTPAMHVVRVVRLERLDASVRAAFLEARATVMV